VVEGILRKSKHIHIKSRDFLFPVVQEFLIKMFMIGDFAAKTRNLVQVHFSKAFLAKKAGKELLGPKTNFSNIIKRP